MRRSARGWSCAVQPEFGKDFEICPSCAEWSHAGTLPYRALPFDARSVAASAAALP